MPGVSPDVIRARSTADPRTYEAFRGDLEQAVEQFSGLPLELHSNPEALKTKSRTVNRILRTNRQELISVIRELLVNDWGFEEDVELRIVSEVDDRDLAVLIQIANVPGDKRDEQHLFVFLRCTECASGAGGGFGFLSASGFSSGGGSNFGGGFGALGAIGTLGLLGGGIGGGGPGGGPGGGGFPPILPPFYPEIPTLPLDPLDPVLPPYCPPTCLDLDICPPVCFVPCYGDKPGWPCDPETWCPPDYPGDPGNPMNPPAAVPEPSSILLFLTGVPLALLLRRRHAVVEAV